MYFVLTQSTKTFVPTYADDKQLTENAFNCAYICLFSKSQKEREEKNIKTLRRKTSVPIVQQRLLFEFLPDLQVKGN